MSHSCFVHSSIDGHLGRFHILAIVNDTAMNIGVLMFFQISVLSSFGYIPRSGIYATEYYLAVKKKKKKVLPFVTVWMDLENIMLSEISQ